MMWLRPLRAIAGVGVLLLAGFTMAGTSSAAPIDPKSSPAGGIAPGLLRVTTSPALPSQIEVDDVIADSWGLNWLKLPAGFHDVCFRDIPAYTTPKCQRVFVGDGETTEVVGVFQQRGFLRVVTSPAVPGNIKVDGIPRNNWGLWTDFAPGTHEVCFGAVANLAPPSCQTAEVVAGETTELTATYTSSPGASGPTGVGSLRVVTSPPVPSKITVFDQRDYQLTDNQNNTWGLEWMDLAPSDDPEGTVACFTSVEGYDRPNCELVDMVVGETTTVTGTFVQRGFLRVITSPALPATIFINNKPVNDWGTYTDRSVGTYTVCFGDVPGVTTPSCQEATVTAGNLTTITGTYS